MNAQLETITAERSIQITNWRRDVNDRRYSEKSFGENLGDHTATPGEAAVSLARFEIGYGGFVTAVSDTQVTVRTPVMSKIDHTTYSGLPGQVLPLLRFAAIDAKVLEMHKDPIVNGVFDAFGDKLRIPLYLTTMGPLLMGASRSKLSIIAFLAETQEQADKLADLHSHTLYELMGRAIDNNWDGDTVVANIEATFDAAPVYVK